MAFSQPSQPNLTDFVTFVRGIGISDEVCPNPVVQQVVTIDSSGNIIIGYDGSIIGAMLTSTNWLAISLAIAMETVSCVLMAASPIMGTLATYNLAVDRLINFAPDVPPNTFFAQQRAKFFINDLTVGIVSSASDQGTSMSQLNPDLMRQYTLADLQTLKTPWGRTYMGIAASVGSLWGVN